MELKYFLFFIYVHHCFTARIKCTSPAFRRCLNAVNSNIYFMFFKGPTVNDYLRVGYLDGLSIANDPQFNKIKETVFYFPGWGEKPAEHQESTDTIATAFLKKRSVNLIVIDYANLVRADTNMMYISAVGNVSNIGDELGLFLFRYIPAIQPLNKVRLVSHSLGSQIMSRTANVFGKGQLKLTGLDPAGPLFTLPFVQHLDKYDGVFVDIIHTDADFYGDPRSIGHVDFYPNLGTRYQPYCNSSGNAYCSHHMSWRYYAESINNETAFPGKECRGGIYCTIDIIFCDCNKSANIAYMGYGVDTTHLGPFPATRFSVNGARDIYT